jgi:uncharacterized membrane protein HdeD (DUF308 family)
MAINSDYPTANEKLGLFAALSRPKSTHIIDAGQRTLIGSVLDMNAVLQPELSGGCCSQCARHKAPRWCGITAAPTPAREKVRSTSAGEIMSTATSDYGPPYSTTSPFDRLGAALARNWWLIGLRGLLGLVFGVIALIMPIATILALVLLFSAYMLVDGVFAIFAAVRAAQQREHWGLLVLQGIASIAAGVIAFLWPGITILAFVLLIAAWSIVSGALLLAAAFQTEAARWWLVVGGIAALVYGVLMIVAPLIGAIVLTWWLGAYALVFGIALLVLAFKLRSRFIQRPAFAATRTAA